MSYTLPPISSEQNEIVESISGGFNVSVDSVAGSGKTTSCLHISISDYGSSKSILLLTYNSKLKIETRERVKALNILNMEVHSYHAFNMKYYGSDSYTDDGIINTLRNNVDPIKKFKYDIILLDEQQDMTYTYFHFVKKIIENNNDSNIQLCLFGDVNQNIYAFKGSDERYLSLSPDILSGCSLRQWKICRLRTSYRITKPMEKFVNDVLLGTDRMRAVKDGSKVRYVVCNSFSSAPYEEINRYILMGNRPEDIFVLAPSINQKGSVQNPIRRAENRLVDNGIPCFVPSDDNQVIDDDIIRGKLVFSSFHQVKGLERDIVIIFNFDNSYFEYYAKNEPTFKCPNTLYVAATRAKKYLTVLHHRDNPYLSFVKTKNIGKVCNVISEIKVSKIKEPSMNIIQTSATELTRHLSTKDMSYVMNLITFRQIQEPLSHNNIVCKIKSKSGQSSDDLFESVSELNGIAIPSLYEYRTTKRMEIYDVVLDSLRKLDDRHRNFIKSLKVKFKNGEIGISDTLRISNIYNYVQTGYKNKLEQIDDYSWLDGVDIELIFQKVKKYLSRSSKYEIELSSNNLFYDMNREIRGRIDVYDVVSDTVWELKCTKILTNEHIIQLAIYSFLSNVVCDVRLPDGQIYKRSYIDTFKQCNIDSLSKLTVKELREIGCGETNKLNKKLNKKELLENIKSTIIDCCVHKYKLLNIMTEEIVEIEFNEEHATEMMRYLLDIKYGKKLKIDDDEFIKRCEIYSQASGIVMRNSGIGIVMINSGIGIGDGSEDESSCSVEFAD